VKFFLVYAHPEPTSFNAALKTQAIATLEKNHSVKVSDLYAMKFNPVASWDDFKKINPDLPKQYGVVQHDAFLTNQLTDDIRQEQEKLAWCDVVIFQFPLWWFGAPAILKGWFERVFAGGFAYDKDKWFETGLLKPRRAMLSTTTQSPLSAYQADGMHGEIDAYLKPIHHTLKFAGFEILAPFVSYGVMNMDAAEREKCLTSLVERLQQLK
jgi:NAD(P)H dehydrogenase (quinone)